MASSQPINGHSRRWPIAEDVDLHSILNNFLVDSHCPCAIGIGGSYDGRHAPRNNGTSAECLLGLQPSLSESVAGPRQGSY